MLTKPFHEHLLWKSKIQLANYTAAKMKKDMCLPEYNTLTGTSTGKYTYNQSIYDEMCIGYAAYSEQYWAGVNQRKAEYRANQAKKLKDRVS